MSINDAIRKLEAAGELVRFTSPSGLPARRVLFQAKAAAEELANPNSSTAWFRLSGDVTSSLATWVEGGRIHAKDHKGEPGFLKRLKSPPPEIWEIRVTQPTIQVRVFGRFAAPDAFVVSHFEHRKKLGKFGSEPWKRAMTKTEQFWQRILPAFKPFTGNSCDDYVTENCDFFKLG